jgi:hypothetical protein
MTGWPVYWPSEVIDWYESLASRFAWSRDTIDAVIASVDYLRRLEESDLPRSYLQGASEGVRWLWEAVQAGGELVAVRQVEIGQDGVPRRYSWRRREDDAGFLTDQALEPAEDMTPLSREAFLSAWG